MKLAKLENVALREVWKHEAKDFTTWLALPENLQLLGDAIELDLEPVEQESQVGKFSVDIIARDVSTGGLVVIENQLEESNHDHLGKCITYASGKEADVVIWIVKKANEEHRKAIEWLNERTDEKLAFFLIEIEALKIGDSAVAPNFKVIERPNEWARAVKRNGEGVSPINQLYQKFWTEFAAYAQTRKDFKREFRTTKPLPHNWMSFASFAKGCGFSLVSNTFKKCVLVKIYISHRSPHYDAFMANYGKIEQALGIKFECGKATDKTFAVAKACDIIASEGKWESCFKWCCDTMLRLKPEAMKLVRGK